MSVVTNSNSSTGARSNKRLRGITIRLVTVILSITVALVIAELVFRAYVAIAFDTHDASDIPPSFQLIPHSKRVYALKPNLGPPLKTNSFGFRGDEISQQKPPNTYRILMLGDSITFGNGVSWNQTFSHILQQELNAENHQMKYEILNLGVAGYNTSQELAVLREMGLQFTPNAVVLNICLNDSDPPKQVSKAGLKNTTVINTLSDINLRTFIESSYVLTVTKKKIVDLLGNQHWLRRMLHSPEYLINARVHETAWQEMKENMDKILATTREHNIPLAVIIYPYSSQLELDDQKRKPQKDLVQFWNERNVPVLDTVSAYQGATETMFEDGVVHLSPYGHQRITTALRGFLHEAGLLPPQKPRTH